MPKVSRIEHLTEAQEVFDITVADNHNFFIRPVGATRSVLVSNCHALTKQAADALLTTLEHPPKHVIFILCTTNPEKLLSTVRGRCTMFSIKPIEPEVMAKRLRIIAKREGTIWKEVDPDGAVMRLMCDLSHGQMRDGIQLLDIILSAVASGDSVSAQDLLTKFAGNSESDMEEHAARIVFAVMTKDMPAMVGSVKACTGNVRGLLSKTRWLLEFLVDKRLNTVKWTPYSGRVFAGLLKKSKDEKAPAVPFSVVIKMQALLCKIESDLNSLSIPEEIQMYTGLTSLFD